MTHLFANLSHDVCNGPFTSNAEMVGSMTAPFETAEEPVDNIPNVNETFFGDAAAV